MLDVEVRHDWPGGFALDAAFVAPTPGVTALFGPSGSGKSTILSAVAGLLRPRDGRIALDGTVLADSRSRLFVPPERRRCGVVFQDARLFPHLSVESNLRYGLRRAPNGSGGVALAEVAALLGIEHLLGRRPNGLSGGERQRVALGRALLARPRLLLMDEPLAALDAPRRTEAMGLIERVRDAFRVPILYVTHALDEVDRLADTLILLEAGRVAAAGPIEALSLRTDLPTLALRRDAGVVLPCRVESHDAARGLTRLSFPGADVVVPLRGEAVGTRLRVRLRARDVAVATVRPEGLSSHNHLSATLSAVEPAGPHEVFLRLAIGPSTLLARVTRDSVSQLGLSPGRTLCALVKSTVFDHGGGA